MVRTVWFNMRQEPVIYVDGHPCGPRLPDKMHENLIVQDAATADLDILEESFVNVIKDRVNKDPELEINHDQQYMENPLERENVEEKVSVTEVT